VCPPGTRGVGVAFSHRRHTLGRSNQRTLSNVSETFEFCSVNMSCLNWRDAEERILSASSRYLESAESGSVAIRERHRRLPPLYDRLCRLSGALTALRCFQKPEAVSKV
jgi:hypothetical protein